MPFFHMHGTQYIRSLIHFFISSKSRLPQDAPPFAKPGDAKKQAAGRVDSSTQSIAGKNDIPGGLNRGLQNKDILKS
jgi:hypothetical protein